MNKSIVAYLDVLGYSFAVDKFTNFHVEHFQKVQNIFRIIKKMVELKNNGKKIPIHQKQILDSLQVHWFSDSCLFSLPCESYNDDELLETLALFVGWFVVLNILEIGWFFRGAIIKGFHYEQKIEEMGSIGQGLFCFSPALILAAKLEKKARVPRIIIDKNLRCPENLKYRDSDGYDCLNHYHVFNSMPRKELEEMLGKMKKGINANVNAIKENPDVKERYQSMGYAQYVCERHFAMIQQFGFDNQK